MAHVWRGTSERRVRLLGRPSVWPIVSGGPQQLNLLGRGGRPGGVCWGAANC